MKNITSSPLWALVFGALAGAGITLALVNPALKRAVDDLKTANTDISQVSSDWQKVSDGWRGRAQSCEAKFAVGTIVYEPRPLVSLPLAGGAFDLGLSAAGANLAPAWYIPAQVSAYSNERGAYYVWQDMRTGKILGNYPVLPPESMAGAK